MENCRLLASPIAALNDPFEWSPGLSAVATTDQIKKYVNNPAFEAAHFAKTGKHLPPIPQRIAKLKANSVKFNEMRRIDWEASLADFRLICLSKRPNGILLWSHYAKGHAGFVVGLRFSALVPHGAFANAVRYENKRPHFGGPFEWDENKLDPEIMAAMKTKSPEWESEQEVRIVGTRDCFETAEGRQYVRLAPSAIESVIFGSRCDPALKNRINFALEKHPELKSSRRLDAKLDEEQFAIHVVPSAVIAL